MHHLPVQWLSYHDRVSTGFVGEDLVDLGGPQVGLVQVAALERLQITDVAQVVVQNVEQLLEVLNLESVVLKLGQCLNEYLFISDFCQKAIHLKDVFALLHDILVGHREMKPDRVHQRLRVDLSAS